MDRLGKYDIRGILGKGAMGTVYDGFDAIIDRRVAIKTMNLPDTSDAEAQDELARFKREAQAAGRLAHPNIVGVYDYGEDGGLAFIVMEFAPGTELKKILDRGDRVPPTEALRIMDGVLAGLQYSHERGVVHRDIKPGNIILSPDGTVKIADFGIARIESSSMTQAGTVMGTPSYMSPEQFMGQTVDARTDIYSAGVMLYQLLTGERPFEGGMATIMHKALNTEAPKPSDLSITAPPALDSVVARAMAKRPADRFETAAAFAAAIRAAMAGGGSLLGAGLALAEPGADDATMIAPKRGGTPAATPSRTAPSPPPARVEDKPKSRLPLVLAGVAVLLALAGVGGYFALAPKPDTRIAEIKPQVDPVKPGETKPGETKPGETKPADPIKPVDPVKPAETKPVETKPADPVKPVDPVKPAETKPVETKPAETKPAETKPADPVKPVNPPVETVKPADPVKPVDPVKPDTTVTKVVPPAPPPTQAAIRDMLTAAVRQAPCSLLRVATEGRGVAITGLLGRAAEPALRQALRDALPANTPESAYTLRPDLFDGPYCPILDTIRPVAAPANGTALRLSLRRKALALHKDESIIPVVAMPARASWLVVDYVSSDGELTHMHPSTLSPAKLEAAGANVVLGAGDKERWQVDIPFGTDILVAITSAEPLFPDGRPDDDTLQTYLVALKDALDAAVRTGNTVTATAILLQTTEK